MLNNTQYARAMYTCTQIPYNVTRNERTMELNSSAMNSSFPDNIPRRTFKSCHAFQDTILYTYSGLILNIIIIIIITDTA